MEEGSDEPNLLGQMAGIIAMMSALIKVLPPSRRKRLLHQTQVEFESLLATMSSDSTSEAQVDRESVDWIRDLFLRRIEQAEAKPTRRRTRKAPRAPAPGEDTDTVQRPASKNVDFEL